ncbi:MAG: YidC/Oxa1 family membrane protein insertase [Myxococcota bacterium]
MGKDTDRRALIAITLCIAVYFFWMSLFPPPQPLAPIGDGVTDGIDDPAPTPGTPATPTTVPSVAVTPPPVIAVPENEFDLNASKWLGNVHSSEGAIRGLALTDYTAAVEVTPLYSWLMDGMEGEDGWQPYQGGTDPHALLTERGALLLAGAGDLNPSQGYILESRSGTIIATHTDPSGLSIVKEYAPGSSAFEMDVKVTFTNNTAQSIDRLWVGVADEMSGDAGRFSNAIRPLAHVDGGVEHFDDLEDLIEAAELVSEAPAWFGVGDRYFMSVLRPAEGSGFGSLIVDDLPGSGDMTRYGAFAISNQSLDAGASRTVTLHAYMGPKQLDILESISPELGDAVELGWFGFFARILLWMLKIFQSGVINWGVAILLLTLIVKLAFFPLTQKAFTSSRRMQALQPKLAALKEKYKDNKELQTQETMNLFKENGVNPMGGCLPTLIQFPVWIALYNVMLYSVELYDSSFLYLLDLTAEDPYGVLPIVYAVLILGQQRMMPMGNMDPAQQRIMKLMPLMFAAFMFTFPSGLVLYFCCNILLTIGQQWLINRQIKIDVPPAA